MTSQHGRSLSSSAQQGPTNYSFDNIQSPLASNAPTNTTGAPQSARREEYMDDGDVTMEDADPYNRMKYPSRPTHTRVHSQHLSQEESSAARRYSPMNTFSPTSSFIASSPQQANHTYNAYTSSSQSARQSPSRGNNAYASPTSQYYSPNGEFCSAQVSIEVNTL